MFVGQYEKMNEGAQGVMVGFLTTLGRLTMDGATPERLVDYERYNDECKIYWARRVAGQKRGGRGRARRPAGGGS
jgi:hypothetical protein